MKRLLLLAALLFASPAFAADDYAATEGAGKTFRCVDVGGVCYPVFAPANTAGTVWVYGNGATGAASPRVTISNDNTIPTGWPTGAQLTTINTTLGSPFQAGGSIGNTTFAATQATSSNLKAQVDPLTAASWALGAFAAAMPANGQGIGLYDGTNMVRAKGDETNGLWVNVKSATGVAQGSTTAGQTISPTGCRTLTSAPTDTTAQTNMPSCTTAGAQRVDLNIAGTAAVTGSGNATGALRVELPTNGTGIVGLAAGSNTIGALTANQSVNAAQINGVTPLMGNGVTGTGSPRVTLASDGTAISTTGYMSVKVDQTTPGTTNGVTEVPSTSGGLSLYFVQPTASDNHVVIKAGAGQVYHMSVMNNSATVNYLRLYNATTGFNGCNSATNIVGQWQIPGNTAVGGYTVNFPTGLAFATGISICVTSGYATTDTTNATASAMSVNVGYK